MKRCTVKEVRKWLRTLEENRYKKRYISDARRIAWFINNNLSEDYETMPKSLRKKWTKAQYGREKYLANRFLEVLEEKETVKIKIKEMVKEEIRRRFRAKKKK
jgi:hypothetical protein